MLGPKRFKFRKNHKPRISFLKEELKMKVMQTGVYGLISMTSGRVNSKQLEASKRVINKHLKKRGKIWLGIFPDKAVTSKPAEVRMGKGKGNFESWVCLVPKGRIIFEIKTENLTDVEIRKIFKLAGERLPLRTRVIMNKL